MAEVGWLAVRVGWHLLLLYIHEMKSYSNFVRVGWHLLLLYIHEMNHMKSHSNFVRVGWLAPVAVVYS